MNTHANTVVEDSKIMPKTKEEVLMTESGKALINLGKSYQDDKDIDVLTIEDLFEKNIKIPDYQRPYLWSKNQVETLLKDFFLIFEKNQNMIYLIGNMIFYKVKEKNEEVLEIVDGQQRTITLALLFHALDKSSTNFLEKISIENPLSKKSIYDNFQVINNYLNRVVNNKKESFLKFVKENIFTTYITAKTQDEAFIFFDSQNTRGKPLDRHDLLKAHHLRDESMIQYRKQYAKQWEEYDQNALRELFETYLTLSRNFVKGNYKFDVDVYEEFKTSHSSNQLNQYNQPPIFKSVDYDFSTQQLRLILKDDIAMKLSNGFLIENGLNYLPFEVTQSISGGKEFFWFTFKYMEKKKFFDDQLDESTIKIINTLSSYLQDYYYSLLFFYFDKYHEKKFEEFSDLIFWIVSHYRLDNYAVRYAGVRNFIEKYNLFSKLFFSYSANEIIKYIKTVIVYELSPNKITKDTNKARTDYFDAIKMNHRLAKIAPLTQDERKKATNE